MFNHLFFFKMFFDVDHFKSLYSICYKTASVFWPRGMWESNFLPGTEPSPHTLEGEVITTGVPEDSLESRISTYLDTSSV